MQLSENEWVLVTGGSGFVGSALVRRLLGLGHNVRVVSRSPQDAASAASGTPAGSGRLEWFTADVRDKRSIAPAFADARYVFHAAALVNSTASYAEFDRANVLATRNVCELAHDARVERLIHVGTCDVFGIPQPGEIMTEKTPYRAWNEPYADTKIHATEIVNGYRGKIVCSTIHPGFVYGPGDRAFVPSLIRQLRDGFFPLWGPREAKVNLIYIDDLVDALMLAAESDAARDEDFIILDEGQVGLSGICAVIARELGLKYRAGHLPYRAMMAVAKATVKLTHMGVMPRPIQ